VCGRYSLAVDPRAVRAAFPVGEDVEIRPRYNVAPGDPVLAVTTDRVGVPRGELLRWGLVPFWADAPGSAAKMINARAETAPERPAFRQPFRQMRCLIPATGFYEWAKQADGRKQAFHITAAGREVCAFAGLWSLWRGAARHQTEAEIRSCAILTSAANEVVAPLHDRMPVILPKEAEEGWLDPETPLDELRALLTPFPAGETILHAVGPAVNDARYDGPECLEAPPAPSPQQPALF
jgi:putative SOS response-associated peptidase YedK